jgi:hypothetical protein
LRRHVRFVSQAVHVVTHITSHIMVAAISVGHTVWLGKTFHTTTAKLIKPVQPIAVPAASTPAAALARFVPSSPAHRFLRFSCFSMSVALAGKIAGTAKNNPPIFGPNSSAITAAIPVINPPKKKRTAYSYHFVRFNAEGSACIFMSDHRNQRNHVPREIPSHTGSMASVVRIADGL